ncbi:glycosyltransferase family 2 protein [Vibrio atypicus]|uniref:glycosyltransferase family 2 protein n=1 Tax=Vibrio atypicus TaxID=558271 RepID=UPI003735AB04
MKIAILLPCYNEEGAIAKTVLEFKKQFPNSDIYVYDNNSTDNTVKEAIDSGAIVRHESRQGKGEVVRTMFNDVEADVYIMADGDNTYDATAAPILVDELINNNLDMVIGRRSKDKSAYPAGHVLGNKGFSLLINYFFKSGLQDVFSGYRVMSRRFVKTIPVLSDGFQIETELTVHALHHKFPIKEIDTDYRERPEGTSSKLRTFKDGFKILSFILFLIRDVRPLFFFGCLSLFMASLSVTTGIPIVLEYFETGLVERFPSAFLASSLGIISVISLFSGFVLDNITRGRVEAILLCYKNVKL